MRVLVALAFACGATAAAVQPLAPAADAHDIVSADSDLQSATFDLETAPEELAGYVAEKGGIFPHKKNLDLAVHLPSVDNGLYFYWYPEQDTLTQP